MAAMTVSGEQDPAIAACTGPLQFIRIDEEGKCHLQENAVALLSAVPGKLAVVGIAGLYRTGKSFLLNRLLGLQKGFEIGPSVNPCTKGLWIWGQPIEIEPDFHCMFIDTEGLGSTQRTASCDMQIFSLCILLSSYLVYNSIGAIDEQSIDDLHLVLNLAKHIHVKSGQESKGQLVSELAEYFPSFHWALRDFHLEPLDETGAPISEREYLEATLKPVPSQDDKNRLREAIKELFRERNCTTLPRPCSNESDLRRIQHMPYEALRPQFRAKVEAFVKCIYQALKPKTLRGVPLSGAMFVELASEYCEAINSSGVPVIQSAWASVLQHQLRLCLNDAQKVYELCMEEKALALLPMEEEVLHGVHKAAKANAVQIFMTPKFDANEKRFLEYREELASRIRQFYEHVKTENMGASRRQCEQCAQELYNTEIAQKLEGHKGSYQNIDQLMGDWERVQRKYGQMTVGPAQAEVLSRLLFQRMAESTQRLWAALRQQIDAQLDELRQKLMREEAQSADRGRRLEEAEREWRSKQSELDRQFVSSQEALEVAEPRVGVGVDEPERNCAVCALA